jgi:hypothetical protein
MSRTKPQKTSPSPRKGRGGSEEKSDSYTPNTLRNFVTEIEDRYVLLKSDGK